MSERVFPNYADSLRQQAKWCREAASDPSIPDRGRPAAFELQDVDTDELDAAANHIEAQAATIARLEAENARLLGIINNCAQRFREYEASHAAKGSIDGDAKARRNGEMAEMCERAALAPDGEKPE